MTRLLIVESPNKTDKIQHYLGSGWVVAASFGFDQASAVNMWEERNDRNAEMGWDLDGALEKRFGCDFSGFCNLVEKLLPILSEQGVEVYAINREGTA
ncbi:hypothetical protein [Cardiobacterium hominis]|uniref:hypothetical protein n=1 Tax=Cardiobacterium hominis TaxID=2718 RepID=UPI0028E663EB|nr:hypothetical protein [Cardiobacterium hominis]